MASTCSGEEVGQIPYLRMSGTSSGGSRSARCWYLVAAPPVLMCPSSGESLASMMRGPVPLAWSAIAALLVGWGCDGLVPLGHGDEVVAKTREEDGVLGETLGLPLH